MLSFVRDFGCGIAWLQGFSWSFWLVMSIWIYVWFVRWFVMHACIKCMQKGSNKFWGNKYTFPLWISSFFGSFSIMSNVFTTLYFNVLWSWIMILLLVLSWQIAHLSNQILCRANIQRTLLLPNQASSLCFFEHHVTEFFWKDTVPQISFTNSSH